MSSGASPQKFQFDASWQLSTCRNCIGIISPSMLLTLTTTHKPATDLGYLLHKNPAKLQTFNLPFGRAQVFYSEATAARCTAALLLEIDPIGLVRGRGPAGQGFALQQYVNDRPYTASSFLSVAISQVFGSALGGRCKDRPLLAGEAIRLEARLSVVPCRPGEAFLRGRFEPLGYTVQAERHALDARSPQPFVIGVSSLTFRMERDVKPSLFGSRSCRRRCRGK
jgi:3' terminal RNA ribose 2'-O-methyltransferase Hen1